MNIILLISFKSKKTNNVKTDNLQTSLEFQPTREHILTKIK